MIRGVALVNVVTGVCVVALLVGAFFFHRDAARSAADARDDLVLTGVLRTEILDAETGLRGFILVGREDFLAPYRSSSSALARTLVALERDVEPGSVDDVRMMGAVIGEWRREFAEPVLAALRRGDRPAAMRIVLSGQGKARIDRLRLLAARVEAAERERIRQAENRVDLAGLVALLAAVAGALVFAITTLVLRRRVRRRVLEPLEHLTDAARQIGGGDFTARAPKEGLEEIDLLAQTFNDMAERVGGVVDELRAIDEMKTRFVSSVSHELRTPLTSIKGFIEVLVHGMAGELNDEQRDYADVVYRNAVRLEALINDLLLLSRLQSGRVELHRATVDVGAILRDLVRGLEPVAAERHVPMHVDVGAEPLLVEADEMRLQQTFANLVSNALKFTPAGAGLPVEITAAPDGEEVVIEVRDRGVGIPADELPRMTERFFRASTAGHVEGTGLGLAITREIVEMHDGRLEIESEVGLGSTFRIRLPVRPSAPEPAKEEAGTGSLASVDPS